jgi:hypothetical protein
MNFPRSLREDREIMLIVMWLFHLTQAIFVCPRKISIHKKTSRYHLTLISPHVATYSGKMWRHNKTKKSKETAKYPRPTHWGVSMEESPKRLQLLPLRKYFTRTSARYL